MPFWDIALHGLPPRNVIDKSGANLAGLLRINVGRKFSQVKKRVEISRVENLNIIIKRDRRFINIWQTQIMFLPISALMALSAIWECSKPQSGGR